MANSLLSRWKIRLWLSLVDPSWEYISGTVQEIGGFPGDSMIKNLPAMQET